ncbi:hypothetical protein AAY473_013852 [Plecturocebus cupreus]
MDSIANPILQMRRRQALALSPRWQYSGTIMGHCSLKLLGSSSPTPSAFQVRGTTERQRRVWWLTPVIPALWKAKVGGSLEPPAVSSQFLAAPFLLVVGTTFGEIWCKHLGRLRQKDHLKPGDPDQPGQHGETWLLLKIRNKISLAWWPVPVVPAIWEAEVGESPQSGKSRMQWAMITPLHSSLGDRNERKQRQTPAWELNVAGACSLTAKQNQPRPLGCREQALKNLKEQMIDLCVGQQQMGNAVAWGAREKRRNSTGRAQRLTPVVPALWEAEASGSPEVRSLRSAWPTQ